MSRTTIPSTEQVMQYNKIAETSDLRNKRRLRDMCFFKDSENKEGSFHQNTHHASQTISRPSDNAKSKTTIFFTQKLRTTNKNSLVHEKENMQANIPISSVVDQVVQSTQTVGTSSKISGKVKKGRGSNKCKEVALLEVGQKIKVIFYNNRIVGKNSNLFSRHLGKLVHDRNMCSLGVSSWDDIKEEKLNHMWVAVKDKFENDDMNIHRDHILGWMKELWNKRRGRLHVAYVKGKPIQKALKNVPKGVEKKQWEWLIKEHFSTEKFQGGKDGKPPNLATIFFETRKKNNTLVDSETIKKHAEIQELEQSEPSLPNIEIVEKCFGPQNRSHVFGFGGGVKAKDLKGGTTSKAELWSELRSTRKENQSLKDRLSNVENEMNEMKQLKDWYLAQHSTFQPPASENAQQNDYS